MLYVGMLRFYLSAAGCSINILHVMLRLCWNVEVLFICSKHIIVYILYYRSTVLYVGMLRFYLSAAGCSINILHVMLRLCWNVEVLLICNRL